MNMLAALDSGLLLAAFNFAPYVSKAGSILAVLIGIGLVIFFHELGHFAVAKWCDVFVERFSIGFGPILWSRKYGETEYALSAIPFGGYVKMLGQDDMDPSQLTSEEIAKDPRSYSAKSGRPADGDHLRRREHERDHGGHVLRHRVRSRHRNAAPGRSARCSPGFPRGKPDCGPATASRASAAARPRRLKTSNARSPSRRARSK